MRRFLAVYLFLPACLLGLTAVPGLNPAHGGRADPFDGAFPDRMRAAATVESGRIGIGVKDLDTGATWFLHGDDRFPMQSVFKAPLGAAVLGRVEAGRLSLDAPVTVARSDLAMQWSPIATAFDGAARTYTVRELLRRAVGESDNTATDVLMRLIGGPGAVDGFLRDAGVPDVRIDRYEREFQPELHGLAPFRQGEIIDQSAYEAAAEAVPAAAKRAALDPYVSGDDPRDTATPRGAVAFLAELQGRTLLPPRATALLLEIMTDSPTGAKRLKAGLPPGSSFAHKTGGSPGSILGVNAATNDIGIATLPDGRRFALAVFLTGSREPEAERERIHAGIARIVADAMIRAAD